MKDDKLKALERLMSGSLDKLEKKSESIDVTVTEGMLETILGSQWVEEELKNSVAPSYMLSKDEAHYWIVNITVKSLQKMPAGIEIIPIGEEGEDKMLCMIGTSAYIVPNEFISYVGWN